ncbi:hypothetical protein DB30_05214 [Enhygromyxa salina]|uniref:Uncharacterized protein n=1 Tax=Enhygromyxa salina TaxID=215803 RepID=A0A0C2CXS8_9BACT|nr:hypothetical protein DB30_05214 [Enhygromyxa salina]
MLILNSNRFESIPAVLAELPALERLHVMSGPLGQVAAEIPTIVNLNNLAITWSSDRPLPDSLGALVNLEYLLAMMRKDVARMGARVEVRVGHPNSRPRSHARLRCAQTSDNGPRLGMLCRPGRGQALR